MFVLLLLCLDLTHCLSRKHRFNITKGKNFDYEYGWFEYDTYVNFHVSSNQIIRFDLIVDTKQLISLNCTNFKRYLHMHESKMYTFRYSTNYNNIVQVTVMEILENDLEIGYLVVMIIVMVLFGIIVIVILMGLGLMGVMKFIQFCCELKRKSIRLKEKIRQEIKEKKRIKNEKNRELETVLIEK